MPANDTPNPCAPPPGTPPRGGGPGRAGGAGAAGGGRGPAGPTGPNWQAQLLQKGWGYAMLNTASIQADSGCGLTVGIIGLMNKGQPRKMDDWGSLRALAWGADRAMDYFETDKAVDAKRVGVEGHSRWGKATLVTMALRRALRHRLCELVGSRRSEAAPPQVRRADREPQRLDRVPLDGRQLHEVWRPLGHAARRLAPAHRHGRAASAVPERRQRPAHQSGRHHSAHDRRRSALPAQLAARA